MLTACVVVTGGVEESVTLTVKVKVPRARCSSADDAVVKGEPCRQRPGNNRGRVRRRASSDQERLAVSDTRICCWQERKDGERRHNGNDEVGRRVARRRAAVRDLHGERRNADHRGRAGEQTESTQGESRWQSCR